MRNLMNHLGDKDDANNDKKLFICLSPDNARIPIRTALESVDTRIRNNSGSSSYRFSKFPILTSVEPRTRLHSRWSNSSPAAIAVEAAVRMADSRGGNSSLYNSFSGKARWECIDIPARWSDDSPVTIAKPNCIDGSVSTRTSPKQLLESSMGGDSRSHPSFMVPRKEVLLSALSSTHDDGNDRWTGKNTTCIPPSPPCRRKSIWDVHQKGGDNPNFTSENVKRIHKTDSSRSGNSSSTGTRSRRTRTIVPSPYNLDDEEINSNTVHTKNTLMSSEMHHYEKHRIKTLIQRLPDSLRVPPY
jgi:hypothetical protein